MEVLALPLPLDVNAPSFLATSRPPFSVVPVSVAVAQMVALLSTCTTYCAPLLLRVIHSLQVEERDAAIPKHSKTLDGREGQR